MIFSLSCLFFGFNIVYPIDKIISAFNELYHIISVMGQTEFYHVKIRGFLNSKYLPFIPSYQLLEFRLLLMLLLNHY